MRLIVICSLALLLASCGSLLYRHTHLRSFDQKLAFAYGVHEIVLQTVPTAVTIGHLTAANGAYVVTLANQSREALDLARTLEAQGHGVAADQSLRLGWDMLTELDNFLKSQRPKSFLVEYEDWKPK